MSFELNRKLAARRPPLHTSASVDPVTAAIIRGGMETICFEAATHLGRAASSPIINQSNERNGSIVDAHGRLAGAAIGTPHLTFVTQMTVRYGLEHVHDYDWGPGDVFLGNDPDHGGGHLPDYNVYAPVFDDEGELILVQCLQAHQGDTGGKDPGGFTLEATDIFTCVSLSTTAPQLLLTSSRVHVVSTGDLSAGPNDVNALSANPFSSLRMESWLLLSAGRGDCDGLGGACGAITFCALILGLSCDSLTARTSRGMRTEWSFLAIS